MSQQINLFNPIFLKEKKHFSAKTMAQGLGVIVVCTLLLYGFSQYRLRGLNQEAAKIAAQLKDTQQQLLTINARFAERKKNLVLEEEVKRAEGDLTALTQAFVRLRDEEFGTKTGYSDYLRAFARQIVPGLWLTGFSIERAGNAIGLQGRALKPELVPAYMGRLKQEAVLQGKSFATLEIRESKESERKPDESAAKPADSTGKPANGVATKVEKKESLLPSFVEFDLRSAGSEKSAQEAAQTSAATNLLSGAKAP